MFNDILNFSERRHAFMAITNKVLSKWAAGTVTKLKIPQNPRRSFILDVRVTTVGTQGCAAPEWLPRYANALNHRLPLDFCIAMLYCESGASELRSVWYIQIHRRNLYGDKA